MGDGHFNGSRSGVMAAIARMRTCVARVDAYLSYPGAGFASYSIPLAVP